MRLAIYLLLALALVGSVCAETVTLVKPASSGTLNAAGSFLLNASMTIGSEACYFYAYSPSTANSSYVVIGSNTTGGYDNITLGRTVKFTVDTWTLEDASDYSFYANCTNLSSTKNFTSAVATSVIVDKSTPSVPSATVPAANQRVSSTTTFSYTVAGMNTTGCTLYVGPQYSYAMTHSGNTCTYSIAKSLRIPEGAYGVYAVATDGKDTATSTTTSGVVIDFIDNTATPSRQVVVEQTVTKKTNTTIAFFLIAAVVLFLFLKRKK